MLRNKDKRVVLNKNRFRKNRDAMNGNLQQNSLNPVRDDVIIAHGEAKRNPGNGE